MTLANSFITARTLMRKWNMSLWDLYLMCRNYEKLKPVTVNLNEIEIDLIVDNEELYGLFHLNKENPNRILFIRSTIRLFEEENGGNIIKSNDLIKLSELYSQNFGWGDLTFFVDAERLEFVDPIGIRYECEQEELFADAGMIEGEVKFYVVGKEDYNLYLRLSDIEVLDGLFDSNIFRSPSESPDDKQTGIENIKDDRNGIKLSFYKSGQIWKIGEYGKESDLTHLNGYDYINLLIENKNIEIDVLSLYHLYKEDPSNIKDNNEVKIYNQSIFEGEITKEVSNFIESYGKSKSKIFINKFIENMESEIENISDENRINELKYKISEAKKYNQKINNNGLKSSIYEKCRINVRKGINKAIGELNKQSPKLMKYLNGRTIKTGFKCRYQEDPSLPIEWILSPP